MPRAEHFAGFCCDVLVHTKGPWARRVFALDDFQREITDPIFGEVVWSNEWNRYVRKYQIAWIELGRKNGKTELAAAIVLYLLVADGEEGAEVYGAAKTTRQAGKVAQVVLRMAALSPVLRRRLREAKRERRLHDDTTGSYYEVIPADDDGELGHNPSGIVIDEFLSQADAGLYEALRTAMGTRPQPLMVLITTAGNDPSSFPAQMHDEMAKVADDARRAPHVFVYMRNLPIDADPWDEANWHFPNPALGSFLSIESLRQEAIEAKNDPKRENAFRQFRLNQWVSQVTRWLQIHRWDASAGPHLLHTIEDHLEGQACWAGLDLASTTDLAAWVLVFPDGQGGWDVLWRFFTPENQLALLDKHLGGAASQWAAEGLLEATEGDWIDYGAIHDRIIDDARRYRIVRVGFDQREATATAQFMQAEGLTIEAVPQGYWLSEALKEIERGIDERVLRTGGHPVARWNAESAEVRTNDDELIKLVKPARKATGKRIDGIAALSDAMYVGAMDGWTISQADAPAVLVGY